MSKGGNNTIFEDLEDLTVDGKIKPCYYIDKDDKKSSGKTKRKSNKGSEPMSNFKVVEGTVNFSNVVEMDSYQGKPTDYNITITMDQDTATELKGYGIRIKEYEGNPQRKFKSRYEVSVFDAEGNPFAGEVPYGSKVRLKYKLGPEHPQWGVSTYLEAVKVLELSENEAPAGAAEF